MNDLTLDQWRELRGKAHVAALLGATWYAQPEDTIGGYCVMPVPRPPSSGYPYAADFCDALVAVHIAELHNAGLAARGNRIDPGLLRWCAWPECFSSYSAAVGPATPGWKRVNSPDVILCPPHAEAGHLPQLVLGSDRFVIRPTCSCGIWVAERKMTLGDLERWWREHVMDVAR
jgi:hypothetical protein